MLLATPIRAAYLIVGLAVAMSHHYLPSPIAPAPLLSAVACVLAWPLQLLGYDLHFH